MSHLHRLDQAARERAFAQLETRLAGREDVAFALVFGSFLEGDAFHDVDVGVWTTGSAAPGLDVELAAVLSRDLGLPVDVRRINDAPVSFLFHVLRGRAVAVRDEEGLANLMERTAREYHDVSPLLRRATREAFAG